MLELSRRKARKRRRRRVQEGRPGIVRLCLLTHSDILLEGRGRLDGGRDHRRAAASVCLQTRPFASPVQDTGQWFRAKLVFAGALCRMQFPPTLSTRVPVIQRGWSRGAKCCGVFECMRPISWRAAPFVLRHLSEK
ncbi:hypothetical protein TcBrA4_0102450 [Trypanosoma cruzi]|nr:hypothetical protein TcBrA4_0102450 [Trypanosoma cruzi]